MEPRTQLTDQELIQVVNDAYSAKANDLVNESYSTTVAQAFGYTPEQLQAIPSESHMGLGCGNPVAAASIKEGETVLDLGSGGGIDVFLAAKRVGITGKVIGIDMSADMIRRARENAAKQNLHPHQVEFIQASLAGALPVVSESVDCILSNCVLNLLPLSGKVNVIKEADRVLKPGGRIVLDDIIAKKPLPDHIRNDLASHVGCIAGAIEIDEYKQILTAAGFTDIVFVDTLGDINIYYISDASSPGCCSATTQPVDVQPSKQSVDVKGCCAPSTQSSSCTPASGATPRSPNFDTNEWVASYQIYALKPLTSAVLESDM